jgi:hypothetical protein
MNTTKQFMATMQNLMGHTSPLAIYILRIYSSIHIYHLIRLIMLEIL